MGIVNYMHQGHGSFIAIVLGPEHVKEIADDGYPRRDIQEFLFEHARMPMRNLRDRTYWNFRSWPEEHDIDDPDYLVPIVMDPKKIYRIGRRRRRSAICVAVVPVSDEGGNFRD